MKILLVNPPNCGRSIPEERYGIDSIRQIFRGEPLSLESLAGNLGDHDVRILDLKIEPGAFHDTLSEFRPDLVGFTAVTCEANTVGRLAKEARDAVGAIVVVGGIHASCEPEFFNRSGIDYVVVGMGKASFAELVSEIAAGRKRPSVPGVAATTPGRALSLVPRNFGPSDLVESGPARYDLVERYRGAYTLSSLGFRIGFVASAYGCPYRCSFCCISSLTGGRYLSRPVESVIADIRALGDTPVIRLVDANTFGAVLHAERLADAILASGIRKNFVVDIRADTVVRHPGLLKRWKEAGLRSVIIGFEEFTDAGLAALEKTGSIATNDEAIALLHDMGITIVGDFIISPEYDEERFDSLERYVTERKIDLPLLAVLTPLPGLPLSARWVDRISIRDYDYYTLTNAVVPTRLGEKRFYERYAGLIKAFHANAGL